MRCRPTSCIHPSLRSLSAGSSGGRPQPDAPNRPGRATSPSSDTPIDNTSFRMAPPVRYIVHRSVHYTPTLDRTFFALSDPTRRRILELLAARPATIGELAEPFGLTLNGVKKHVRPEEVFDAFTDPEGQEAFYGQDDPGWIVRSQCDLRIRGVWTVA